MHNMHKSDQISCMFLVHCDEFDVHEEISHDIFTLSSKSVKVQILRYYSFKVYVEDHSTSKQR